MKPVVKLLIVANLVALFIYLALSVDRKETLIAEGDLLLLQLAPVDPRSLMQGDYMTLDYAIEREAAKLNRKLDGQQAGYVVVRPDSLGVAQLIRLQPKLGTLDDGEFALPFRANRFQLDIGAGSYFFQEGRAYEFARAQYGGLRVDKTGDAVLIGLYDKERTLIK